MIGQFLGTEKEPMDPLLNTFEAITNKARRQWISLPNPFTRSKETNNLSIKN